MKKIWKILGGAALAAALVPYSFYNKDTETGEVTTQALLWKVTTRPGPDGKRQVELSFGVHIPTAPKGSDEMKCHWVTREEEVPAAGDAPVDAPAETGEEIALTLTPDLSDLGESGE